MENLNQYYTDITSVPSRYFNNRVYDGFQDFNINDYIRYKSRDYYTWINNNLKDYSFPPDYDHLTFEDLCENTDYSLKPQQKFAGRIFNNLVDNHGMLVYHGLGSGKTQTSIVIAEAFKFRNVKGNTIIPGRTDSVVLIVVPASLVDQYYSEIIGNVENGVIKSATGQIVINGERQFYLNKRVRTAITQNLESIKGLQESINLKKGNVKQMRDQILQLETMNRELYDIERKKVNTVYEILSHERFLNRIFTIKNGNFIEGEYLQLLKKNNGLLIIDEAHGLVSALGSNYRKLLIALRYYTANNFRVVLLTGSPIYDKPFEFGLLMNLLRPRMLFPDGFENFNEIFVKDRETIMNRDLFKQMCSGYVSYFKGGNPEAYPYKRVIIMHHQMENYQYSVYKNALIKEVERDQKNRLESREEFVVRIATSESLTDETTTSVFNNSRLFCNVAFPESIPNSLTHTELVNIGRKKFQQDYPDEPLPSRSELYDTGVNITKRTSGKSRQQIIQQGLDEFKKRIMGVENPLSVVKGYSSKFAKIAEIVEMSEGPVFIYSNYVFYGVEAMAAVMESIGYKNYPSRGSRGSYFIWKGQADPDEIKRANRAFNSLKNSDGSVLKIMFGTQSVMEGVDFKRVRQIHVLDPWWNDSRMQQIIARGIRLCSHKELPEQQREVKVFIHLSTLGSGELLYSLQINTPEGRVKKVYSTLQPINLFEKYQKNWIYLESYIREDRVYNSKMQFKINDIVPGTIQKMSDPELTKRFGRWKQLDSISVEQYMYNRSLQKLNLNRQFEMAIKESAIDCDINRNGNIVRLEEIYIPEGDLFRLEFLNYSTGQVYLPLQERYFTLDDIFSKGKNDVTEFKRVPSGEIVKLPRSLIVPENISCNPDLVYKFNENENVPESIVNLTINKELIQYLKKMDLSLIKKYFFEVEHSNTNPQLAKRIKRFYSRKAMDDKQVLIDSLKNIGIDEEVWDLYTTEELKKIASKIIKKRIVE
jgi:superfamily II DNA or RNA helicase